MTNHNHQGTTMKTIDCTPVGLTTPEGIERVNKAKEGLDTANARAAQALAQLMDQEWNEYQSGGVINEIDVSEYRALVKAVDACRAATEEFLRAIAGAPARQGGG